MQGERKNNKEKSSEETNIVFGMERINQLVSEALARTANTFSAMIDSSSLDVIVRSFKDELYSMRNRGVRIRCITTITPQNISKCRPLMEFCELRHIKEIKGNFAVTENEYFVADEGFGSSKKSQPIDQVLHGNFGSMIQMNSYFFEMLWEGAIPAKQKISDIESGILEEPMIEVIHEPFEIQERFVELVDSAASEIMLIFPSPEAFHREEKIGVIDSIVSKAEGGVNVRVLSPTDSLIDKRISFYEEEKQERRRRIIDFREIARPDAEDTVTIFIVDKKACFTIEQARKFEPNFVDAVGTATYSTSRSTVASNVLSFETLWQESELRAKEEAERERSERSRRQAELLQDILAHDIRNYNQVSRLSTELLREELKENDKVQVLIGTLLGSIDGSTELLERAKKLAKVVSEVNPKLYPISLEETIENSLALIKASEHKKRIIDERRVLISSGHHNEAFALADDLLYEVFVNLFSNSARYTNGNEVYIESLLEDSEEERAQDGLATSSYWKITITDKGVGIPEETKEKVFSRYLDSAKGSGLGMSIVHALVIDRYHGKIKIKDRVKGDHTQGTSIEIWLPKAHQGLT